MEWGEIIYIYIYIHRYTVSTRMTPALRWAAMKAILMFYQVVEVLLYVHKNRRLIRDGQLDFHTAPEL